MQARSRQTIQAAIANQQSPEGAAYKKRVESKFITFVQQCELDNDADLQKFDYVLLVDKEGVPQNGWSLQPTNMRGCLGRQFIAAQMRKEALFPPPPRAAYWVKLEVDPVALKAASN